MTYRLLFAGVIVVCLTAGCVGPVKQTVPFNEGALIPYKGTGKARIEGEAFAKTRSGEVRLAAGLSVFLVPQTEYTTERIKIMSEGREPEAANIGLIPFIQQTTANSQGKFEFKNIPTGRYYLYCKITWEMPDGHSTGGYLLAQVNVANERKIGPIFLQAGKALY